MTHGRVEGECTRLADVAVLIPAWQPDQRLTNLVSELLDLGFGAIVIVDDGSGSDYGEVFQAINRQLLNEQRSRVHIVHHAANLGKGRALKTGLSFFLRCFPDYMGVVTADADGQHRPADVFSTAEQLRRDNSCMVLGSRRFQQGVPLRSHLGNLVTRRIFATLTGRNLSDTQSGLRGIPAELVPSILALEGERYEYEMNVLTHVARSSGILEVPIEAVYLDGNRSSHFRPITDSMRIYFVLLRFFASSLIAAGIDFTLFAIVFAATSNVLSSIIAGRLSSLANFALNRQLVFKSGAGMGRALAKYYMLVAGVGAAAYFSIQFMAGTLEYERVAGEGAGGNGFVASQLLNPTHDSVCAQKPGLNMRGPNTTMGVQRPQILLCGGLLLALVAAYSNHFGNSFHYDDAHAVVNNPSIRRLTNVPHFFVDARTFSSDPRNQSFRPLVTASLALDYALGDGLKVFWFHLSTFIWFTVQLVAMYWLYMFVLQQTSPSRRNTWIAWFAVAVYGLHPVSAETVNYIVQRGDLYVALGMAGGIALYAWKPSWRRYGLYLVPPLGAMFSKPTVSFSPCSW